MGNLKQNTSQWSLSLLPQLLSLPTRWTWVSLVPVSLRLSSSMTTPPSSPPGWLPPPMPRRPLSAPTPMDTPSRWPPPEATPPPTPPARCSEDALEEPRTPSASPPALTPPSYATATAASQTEGATFAVGGAAAFTAATVTDDAYLGFSKTWKCSTVTPTADTAYTFTCNRFQVTEAASAAGDLRLDSTTTGVSSL